MKFFLFSILWLVPLAGHGDNQPANPVSCWASDSVVNVYFVRDVFTTEEKKALEEALKTWSENPANKFAGTSFLMAGETGGLIDCSNCLTIARLAPRTDGRIERASINSLRETNDGRLISAWIALAPVVNTPADLRSQLLELLERRLRIDEAPTTAVVSQSH